MENVNVDTQKLAADNLQQSWRVSADNEAKKMGAESAQQEYLTNRLGMVSERLNKLNPSADVLNKGNKFLEKQAKKLDAKLKKMEAKYKKSFDKANDLGEKSTDQSRKVKTLAEKRGNRITSSEVTQNWKLAAAREGANVNIKDGSGWFDRNVTSAIDNLRISWNEALSKWNAGRAEKEFGKASDYRLSAETLRDSAQQLRQNIVDSESTRNSRISARQEALSDKQEVLSEDLIASAEASGDAARRLDVSRTELPDLAKNAADQIRNGAAIGTTTETYYQDAQKVLDNKPNNQVQ